MPASLKRKLGRELLYTVVGLACAFFAFRFAPEAVRRWRTEPPVQIGSKFIIPGEDEAHLKRVLVIAGSDRCQYSRQSVDLDRQLMIAADSLGIPVKIIAPTPEASAWYSSQLSAPASWVITHSLASLGFRGTPTVMLRNKNGIVEGLWEGFLPPDERRSVIARISGRGHTLEPPELDRLIVETVPGEKPYPVKAAGEKIEEFDDRSIFDLGSTRQVIDVREREFFHNPKIRNEINIPAAELNVRARIELNRKTPTVVDCSQTDVGLCDLASAVLVSLNFDSVSVLDRGARGIACKITPTR